MHWARYEGQRPTLGGVKLKLSREGFGGEWYRLSAFQYNIAMKGFLLLNVSFPIVLSFLSNSLLIFVRVSAMENHLDITACEDVPVEKEGSYLRVRLSISLVASPLCALLLLYIQKNLTLHPAR